MDKDRLILGTEVQLPSRGLLYGDALPEGHVVVAPMKAPEEKMLVSIRSNEQATGQISRILETCVDLHGFKAIDLLITDRFFLMLMLRAVSWGGDYTFRLKCSSCSQTSAFTKVIPDDFEITYLSDGFTEPFTVDLPVSKAQVSLRLLRGIDEAQIEKYATQAYSRQLDVGDPAYTYRLARHIVSVHSTGLNLVADESKQSLPMIIKYLDNLYVKDTAAIRKRILEADCGLNLEIDLACPRCGADMTVSMPFTREFFRPDGDRAVDYS